MLSVYNTIKMAAVLSNVVLNPGDSAPTFLVNDVHGHQVDLARQKRRFTLLAFLRYSACPWCNLAIHRLAMEYPTFLENDCDVVAFIQSDKDSIVTNIHKRHAVVPQFPIVADKERKYYKLYGVSDSPAALARSITKIPAWVQAVTKHGFKQGAIDGQLFLVPAYFLIDNRSGEIAAADYGKSFYDHDTFVKLYEDIFFRAF